MQPGLVPRAPLPISIAALLLAILLAPSARAQVQLTPAMQAKLTLESLTRTPAPPPAPHKPLSQAAARHDPHPAVRHRLVTAQR